MSKFTDLRGLSDETAKHFAINETKDGWVYPSPHEHFRRWKNYSGTPKYLWKPSGAPAADLVYNLEGHAEAPMLYLCEGEPDVWAMYEAGEPSVSFMAGAGTMPSEKALTDLAAVMVEPYEVRIIYDRDEVGEHGAQEIRGLLKEWGFQPKVLLLPVKAGNDVSDLWQAESRQAEAFHLILASLEEWQPAQPGSFAVSVPEWLEAPMPPLEYVVEGLLVARSVVLLAGQWASGKSWFMADAGISVATGRPLMSHFRVALPGAVMLLDQDSPEDDQRRRYRNLLTGYSLNGTETADMRVAYYQSIDVMSERWQEEIREAILHFDIKLLMFDAMIRFHHLNENSASEMAQVADVFRSFANLGPCVMVAQQMGKPREGVLSEHRVRGSSGIMDMVDVCFGVSPGHATEDLLGQEYFVNYLKPPRFGPKPQPFIYTVHGPSEGPNTVRYKGEAREDQSAQEQGVVAATEYLAARGPTRRGDIIRAIRQASECGGRTADLCLDGMVADGLVVKLKRGVYQFAATAPEMLDDTE